MAIPNQIHEVEVARQQWPQDWKDAHTGNANTEGFIRKLAARLYAQDARWGLNGKRGNPQDISDDVLAYRGEGTAVDVVNGGPMEIIDVIAGAGGPSPTPAWIVAPGGPGDKGTWVKPAVSGPAPGPVCPDPSAHIPKPPPPYPGDRVFDALGIRLIDDYAAAGRTLDFQSGTWFGRVIYDHLSGGLTMEQSIQKHRGEWLAALGLR